MAGPVLSACLYARGCVIPVQCPRSSRPLDSSTLDVLDIVRTPHRASILKERSDKGLVGLFFYRLVADL